MLRKHVQGENSTDPLIKGPELIGNRCLSHNLKAKGEIAAQNKTELGLLAVRK